ncbi:MAG: ATP-binding cassette domain-containing protein [Chitinophagaceae bacterium]|nr:ATP-binding cassette domain-containing protein [Chitinophagaceae bacterium]
MLELQHLVKNYATQKAVDDISLTINKGKIFGLLGPNGAGKSSLLRMVTGITMPDSGTILFNGEVFNPMVHNQFIGYMPEERGLYKKMKIGEQTLYLAQLKGIETKEAMKRIKHWFEKFEMVSWWNKKVEDLSKGMQQKLQFITTILHEPQLLILDEPFSGLDPLNSEIIKDEIRLMANNGTTIIFSTHRMEQVEEICEEIILVNKGQSVLQGNLKQIKEEWKKNIFLLETKEAIPQLNAEILNEVNHQYTIKLGEHQDANQILSQCIQQGISIIKFQEIYPTLNEIFIEKVEGSAARAFLK